MESKSNRRTIRRRNTRKRQQERNNNNAITHPPQIKTNVIFKHTYRFTCTTAYATGITTLDVLYAMGCVGRTVNATVANLFQSARIRRMTVLSAVASQGSTATCTINWTGYNNAPNFEVSDTTTSTAVPARISTVPPNDSLAKFWFASNLNQLLLTLYCPIGSIIDLDVEGILQDGDTSINLAVATAAIGVVYYLALDFPSTGGHTLPPVALTTTF